MDLRKENIQHEPRIDQSLQSEGSFIVLGRSSSQNDIDLSQVFNASTSISNSSITHASLASNGLTSTNILNDLSPDEIQNKIQALVQENIELKEALRQNNLAMKQQFNTLVMWQEEVFKVHQNHKQKFGETKELILKLRTENTELRKMLAEFESNRYSSGHEDKLAKLQAENNALREKIAEVEAKDKVTPLLEFQLKTENADLKEKLQEMQAKVSSLQGSEGHPSNKKHQSPLLAVVAAEREELGSGRNDEAVLHQLGVAMPPQSSTSSSQARSSPPSSSFVMVEGDSRRSPCEGSNGGGRRREEETKRMQLEEMRHVVEVERQAIEEDRKALEKARRAMHVRMMEAQGERERLERKVAELTRELEAKKVSTEGRGTWVVVEESSGETEEKALDGGGSAKACESRLGLLRSYFVSQEHKNIKMDVLLQKVYQILVSLMALDPSKGKEMMDQVQSLRKELTAEVEDVNQLRVCLSEAENMLLELKMGFDALQTRTESISTVVKENVQANYHKVQADEYRHQLDETSARLAEAEEALANARSDAVVLSEKLRRAEVELEAIPILKTQVEVYQADFNTEREERARMASEKQHLSEEVQRLRGQNQLLLDDLENLERRLGSRESRSPPDGVSTAPVLGGSATNGGGGVSFARSSAFNTLAAPGRGPFGASSQQQRTTEVSSHERTTRGSSEPRIYSCPKCFKAFMEFQPLEVHVNQCLDNP